MKNARHTTVLFIAGTLVLILGIRAVAYDPSLDVAPPPEQTTAAITDLQQRMDIVERDAKAAEKTRKQLEDSAKTLDESVTNLKRQVEQIDRNDLGQIKRDLTTMDREIKDLTRRVRNLE